MRRQILSIIAAFLCLMVICGSALAVDTQSASPLGNENGGKSETAIGDLVADSIRAALGTDIAFIAASDIKAKNPPIPAGKVSSSDISGLVSYVEDPLAVISLNGKTLRAALEKSVAIYPQPNLGFMQISGARFSFDPRKPAGKRVSSVTVGSTLLDENRTYTIAVTNSMANGALGYWRIWTKDAITRKAPETTIVTAVDSYFKANPNINYNSMNRITVIEK